MATVPSGWKDDGKTLVAPNEVPIIRGVQDFVLRYAGGWEHDSYPERAEAHRESVEPGSSRARARHAQIGAGVRQNFRWRSLGWTTSRGAYVIWVGHDIIALETQLDAANKHIAQLEEQLKQAQQQAASVPTETPRPEQDPRATEALSALAELAQALKLVDGSVSLKSQSAAA